MRKLLPILLLASSLLPASAALARSVSVIGAAGEPGEDGESVMLGDSELATGADPAELLATAWGGLGGYAPEGGGAPAGDGGGAELGPLYAASDSGDVTVNGTARGGDGGFGREGAAAGDGAPVRLRNAVDGDTTGHLLLSQLAQGGDYGFGEEGRAGAAASHLHRRKAAERFELLSRAVGGGAAPSRLPRVSSGDGAPARATARGVNLAGEMSSLAMSLGGRGGADLVDPGGRGGDASVLAYGRTRGDGHPVKVGIAAPLVLVDGLPPWESSLNPLLPTGEPLLGSTLFPEILPVPVLPPVGAQGGPGGGQMGVILPPGSVLAGEGGDATSVSLGVAEGDSPVEVFDRARGGDGGLQAGLDAGPPPPGGAADSRAYGVGAGASPVEVAALAEGGIAGSVVGLAAEDPPLPEAGVPGGAARALAVAAGHGEVLATATARGGAGTGGPSVFTPLAAGAAPLVRAAGGPAHARAMATGASGEAVAGAQSNASTLSLDVTARVSLLHAATATAQIRRGLAGHGHADASVLAAMAPASRRVERLLAGEPELAAGLAAVGADAVAALGHFVAEQHQRSHGHSVLSVLELDLGVLFPSQDPQQAAFVGLFAPELRRRGFVSLRLRLMNEADVLVDELFDDPAQAQDFLDGALLPLGSLAGVLGGPGPIGLPFGLRSPVITLRLELETRRRGAELGLGFLVATAPQQAPAP